MIFNKTRTLALALCLCSATALAGPLAGDTSTYLTVWHGSSPFQGYSDAPFNTMPTNLTGYIDWAVYAPGSAPAGFSGYAGYDPGQFLYTYQAYETGSAPLSAVQIQLTNPAFNIGNFTATGIAGDAIIGEFLIPFDSANWLFDGVPQGGNTTGLAFNSPNVPMFLVGTTIDDGSVAVDIPVPSPDSTGIPEPGTFTLAALGLAAGAFGWLRRKRTQGSR